MQSLHLTHAARRRGRRRDGHLGGTFQRAAVQTRVPKRVPNRSPSRAPARVACGIRTRGSDQSSNQGSNQGLRLGFLPGSLRLRHGTVTKRRQFVQLHAGVHSSLLEVCSAVCCGPVLSAAATRHSAQPRHIACCSLMEHATAPAACCRLSVAVNRLLCPITLTVPVPPSEFRLAPPPAGSQRSSSAAERAQPSRREDPSARVLPRK